MAIPPPDIIEFTVQINRTHAADVFIERLTVTDAEINQIEAVSLER